MPEDSSETKTSLPFTHGIEVELQVIRRDGTWIRGEEILTVFDSIVSKAKELLDHRIRSSSLQSVRKKYNYSTQTEEGERGSRIVASYEGPDGVFREYTLVGHDPNVTSLTWILEVATPPCTTLEELAWWVQTLIAVSHESIPEDSRAILVSTGLNPTQEYLKNLSFGEHHHILGPDVDDDTKVAVYNMIRNFIPHLIAISVNSPFENKKPTNSVSVDGEGRTRAPRCLRSIRLQKNTTQMGPTSEFEFIPHLEKLDKEGFARYVNRSFARMVDAYPFTDYDTIEIRV
ncbi:MAG: glutamate-cysteine ligase family protein, partial [Candidatus Thorarchaeota archaeon]